MTRALRWSDGAGPGSGSIPDLLLSAVLSCALCFAPVSAGLVPTSAVAATQDPYAAASEEDVSEAARAEAIVGDSAMQRGEHDTAISHWQKAYGLSEDDAARWRYAMLLRIVSGHEAAFAQDGDTQRLRKAKGLIDRCASAVSEIFDDSLEQAEETAQVQEIQARIDAALQSGGSAALASAPAPAPAAPGPMPAEPGPMPAEPGPTPADPGATPSEAPPADTAPETGPTAAPAEPTEAPDPNAGRGLRVGGGLAIGLGVASLGLTGFGMVAGVQANDFSDVAPSDLETREAQVAQGRTANALSLTGLGLFAVGLGAGIAMTVVGKKKGRSGARSAQLSAPQPWINLRGGGLTMGARF